MNGNESRVDIHGYKMKEIGITGNKTVEVRKPQQQDKIQSNIICSESKHESVHRRQSQRIHPEHGTDVVTKYMKKKENVWITD